MIKKIFSIQTFLVVLIFMYQFNFLIGGLKVSADTNMLPPSNLAFQSVTPDDGKLTWSAVYGATGYKVYEIKEGQLISLGTTTAISYSLNDLPEGSHRYVVSTLNSEGESGPSAPVSAEIIYPKMLAPATLNSTIRNGNDIVLSWSSSQYAQKYNIYQISESGERTLLTSTTATTYTIVKAAEGLHTYSVSAYHALYGESANDDPIKVEVSYPEMKQPSNLSFTITNGTDVNLKWQGTDYTTSYKIYQDIDGKFELQKTVTGTNVTFSNQSAGDYTYKVYSYSDRFGESKEGGQISLTVGSIAMTAPSNVTYKIQNTNDVVLNWETVPYATAYNLYELNNGEKTLKNTVKGTTVTYSMLKGGEYEYIIHSYSDRFGESETGSKVSFSIDTIKIYPPKELSYKIQNGNDIVLSWSNAENAANYKVYQIIDGQKILKNTVTGTSITFTNMPSGSYEFEVRTNSTRFGESEDGAQVSFTLGQVNMSAPKNAKYEIKNGNDITLSWDAAENATNYRVYQVVDGKKVLKSTVSNLTAAFTNLVEGDIVYEIYSYSSRFGESKEGTVVEISLVYPKMLPPANVTQTTVNPTSFTLSWNSIEYATSYKVYQIVDGQKILKNNVTGTSTSYSNILPGSYKYEVYSYSTRFGESKEGTPVEVIVNGKDLPAPENVSYSILNGNDLTLKWNPVEYATSYKIYQIINGEATLTRTVTTTNTTLVNFPAGDFNFVIKAYSSFFGESSIGAEVKGTMDFPIMAKPENLTYNVTNGNDINLKWGTVPYATAYKIYQIVGEEKVLKGTLSTTTTTFTNMPEGDYKYIVHSYSDRFGESPEGSVLEFKLASTIMQAPGNFTKTIMNENDIVLKWNPSTYAQEYRVYQVIDGEKVLQRKLTGTTITFTNMPEDDYKYVVHSYSPRFGESPEGSVLEFSLTWPVMQAPGNFTKTITNGNDIVLKWNASTYAQEYRVYQVVDGEKVLKRKLTGMTTTFTNMPEDDYKYVVHSYNPRFGESPEGSVLEFKLASEIMQAPSNFTKTITNGNDTVLKWSASTYAQEYRVYQVVDGEKVLKRKLTGTTTTFTNMPEDDYEYVVHSYSDRFGESPEGSVLEFNLTWPVMQAPGNFTKTITNGNDIVLKWNVSTYAQEYRVYQVVDGEKVLKGKLTGTTTTFTNMPEGDYEYIVHSYSTRFGESPEGSVLEFNLTWPVMQAPGNFTKTITNVNDIVLKWNASTYTQEYRIYQIIDGEKVLQRKLTGTTTTFTNMPEGDYKYVIHSYGNRFGESPEGSPQEFNLTWPIVEAPTLTGSVFNANNITLSWKAVTWANEYRVYKVNGENRELIYKGTSLSYKVYNLTEDTHSFEVTAYSTRFGESAPSESFDQKIVYPIMESPNASLKLLNGTSTRISWDFVTYANNYNIYEIIEGKPVLLVKGVNNLSYDIHNLSYANHEYYVTAYSNSFGESKPSQVVIAKLIIDTEPPETKINAPIQWVNQDQLIKLEATDNEVGVAKTYYSINGSEYSEGDSFTVEREGINKISYYSVDKAGNKEEVRTAEVKIDKIAPKTSSNTPETWLKEGVVVALKAEDELSGVVKTYYSINGSEYAEGSSFVVEKEGTNKVSYYSVDAAGNKEEVKTVEIKVDKTAPTTTSNVPKTWIKEDVTVTLKAEDELSGVIKTYYSINGSGYSEGSSFVVGKEGINKVSYYSVDAAGNKEEVKTAEIKIDKTAPTVSVALEEEYKLGENFILDYRADDNLSGIAIEEVTLNGNSYKKGDQLTLNQPGDYNLRIKVTDAVGLSTVVEKTFTSYIPITLEILPKVMNGNKGIFTVKATLPVKYQSFLFDISSVKLDGVSPVLDNKGLQNQAEKGHFKFNREEFVWTPGEVSLELRGYVGNKFLVVGKAAVEVKK
ncbi:OmpL47-type beta-barrel domain-containing protein [Metabacillus fastidiosus]|uniref:OmpL47-type beta-barrel domain-containing protein n=1 Tax=Metabacillus fastidiosus TaxID=1458 RepID=UPI003D2BDCF0